MERLRSRLYPSDNYSDAGGYLAHQFGALAGTNLSPLTHLAQRQAKHVNGYQNPRKYGAAFFSGIENASTGW